ncbi:restriction endonuclease subunit S [Ligilactobacillus aviarius]|uniref:restriction endonuclease subunit S n=1 Tax=Ligilactobacillus aviarius TaxID=1606 RepID=UPI0024BB12C4|nr:restriction endonuclease subunit S [Ligilactobacillus aviarius]
MTKTDKEGQRKTPILRFKGFTDDWEQRKLGDISEKRIEKNNSLSIDNILSNSAIYGIVKQNQYFDKTIANNIQNYYIVHTNDFIYNPRISNNAPFGPISRNKLAESGVMSPLYLVFYFSKKSLSDFFEIYFKSSKWHNFMYMHGNSGARSDRFAIKDNEFFKMRVKIPHNKSEIDKIYRLNILLNSLITLYEKKKQLLTQLKQGIVNFLITKNGQKPQLRFSGFNNNWESKSFEKLLNYEQPTKYIVKKADYISQGTPVLTANKSFVLGYTNETNVYQNIPAIIFDDFTLESKYVDFPFMVKSSAIKILTSKNSNLFFIYQLLNNQRFVQEGHSRHYISVVQKKKVLVPSIQEQNKISDLIKQLEDNIELNSNTIVLLKKLKEFLLQNMFL